MRAAFAIAAGVAFAISAAASAQEVKLPPQLAWTAYDTGSSGFNQVVAFGQALKNKYGVDMRVIPGSNDVARMTPLKQGRVQASANGVGTWWSQEGMDVFAVKDWGPQKVRVLFTVNAANAISLGVANDVGIKSYRDLKGKRVGWVVGSAALNGNAEAILAFAGLGWKDVQKVEFPGYGAMWKGMVNNQVDAAIASTISGQAKELEVSPRGIFWPPTPHGDKEGWARLQKVAPFYKPHMATDGVGGISKDKPYEGPNYPYPINMVYDTAEPDLVYNMVKAAHLLLPHYKDGAPGADGWDIRKQDLDWVVPYHEGAVRYMKEVGMWSDAAQKAQDRNVRRQEALATAWTEFRKTEVADDVFQKEWVKARAAGLTKAGLDPIWTE